MRTGTKDYKTCRTPGIRSNACAVSQLNSQREGKRRRELYASGKGLVQEGELRPQNKNIMDEIDRVGAAREGIHPETARANDAPKKREESEATRNATEHP